MSVKAKYSEAQRNVLLGLFKFGRSDVGNFWLGTVIALFKKGLVQLTAEEGTAIVSLSPMGLLEASALDAEGK